MKKLTIIALVAVAAASSAFAQGRVSLGTAGNTAVNVKLVWPSQLPSEIGSYPGFAANATVATGSGFAAVLLYSLTPGITDWHNLNMNDGASVNVSSGYFVGGNRTITGWTAGPISAAIAIWNKNDTATFGAAPTKFGAGWAITAVAQVTPTVSPTAAPYLPLGGTSANPILLPVTFTVPEPASASIVGLGLASLLIFRRRK